MSSAPKVATGGGTVSSWPMAVPVRSGPRAGVGSVLWEVREVKRVRCTVGARGSVPDPVPRVSDELGAYGG